MTPEEIMRKHPELTRAEAEWMTGETEAPFEVLCGPFDDETGAEHTGDNTSCSCYDCRLWRDAHGGQA